MIRRIATGAVAIAGAIFTTAAGPAQAPPDSAWVQWAADGKAHARAIVHAATCPALVAGGRTLVMTQRAAPQKDFADRVCDAVVPAAVTHMQIGATALPAIAHLIKRIAVFSDPRVAGAVAAEHPDLVIHAGNDEPTAAENDDAATWSADYFAPMAPLLAVAPLIEARGDRDTCTGDALGWSRYLSGLPTPACVDHEPPSYALFDNMLVANVDDAAEATETMLDPRLWTADLAIVQDRARAAGRDTLLVAHRPALTYLLTHENSTAAPDVDLYVSGHLRVFGAYAFLGEAPQVIAGVAAGTAAADADMTLVRSLGGTTDRRFGYAIFNSAVDGWAFDVHDADGTIHRRCHLALRVLTCGAALTNAP